MTLLSLAAKLHRSLGLLQKQDIQVASHALKAEWINADVRLGDDCAAIPDRDGFLLFAAEGMLPQFVEQEPWFAGWSAVMVNVSDIYAMGGTPIAVVDTIWSKAGQSVDLLWEGMRAASAAYHVPIVGGHTNCHSSYTGLSVAILGRANRLITSFDAQPEDVLLIATDFQGEPYQDYPFWNAATKTDPIRLRENLSILPKLAEMELCKAGKDISMGGIIGTLIMLLETSNCGAVLDLDRVPCPNELALQDWLVCFPSYGFLLSVQSDKAKQVQALFHEQNLICEVVGEIQADPRLILKSCGEAIEFWDFSQQKLTGFSKPGVTV
jgi:uncharacterized protein